MSISAISFTSTQTAVPTKKVETQTPNNKGVSKATKVVAVGISVAALAAMAAIAMKKGKINKIADDFIVSERSINRLVGLKNAKAVDKTIAEVAERTSEAGVNKWLEHFGEGAEHVVQDLTKYVK